MFLLPCALAFAAPAFAQVQRSFLNSSFETPALTAGSPAAGCYRQLDEALVPGWTTTHPSVSGSGDCTSPSASSGRLIELWRTNFGGVIARSGNNFSELNAEASSRIYQNVCLINGERIAWRFSHRGRGSATVRDVMAYNVGASLPIVRVGTTSSGAFDAPIVSQGTALPPASGGNGWVDYSGVFNHGGVSGVTSLGFESISTGGGSNTVGNFLDNIQIELSPFAEFSQPSSSTPESASNNVPTLRLNGTVLTPFAITVTIVGGTAVMGTDYATPGNSTTMTVAIPAGVYDGVGAASLFPVPITVTQDALVEGNETIQLQVQPASVSPAPFLLNSSSSCGAAAQTAWVYTIVDDDTAINITKNAAPPAAVSGQPTQFDLVYTIDVNNPAPLLGASYSLSDVPGLDSNVSVLSASFTLNGGAATALSGSGPWTLQPQWRALAAGATDIYVLTLRIGINRGGSIANDACASPSVAGSGLHNNAAAVLQGTPGNTTFNASACRNTPTPVWTRLQKTLGGRAAATDQVQVRMLAGGNLAASAVTSGSTVPATTATGLIVVPAGTTMQFEEAIKPNGTDPDQAPINYASQMSCSNASAGSATVLPSGAGSVVGTHQTWAEFTPDAGDDIDCTITNTPLPIDLSISKTNTPAGGPNDQASDTVTGSVPTTYDIVVRNNSVVATSFGATLRDPATPSLGSCQLDTPPCAVTGTGTCPTVGAGAGQLSVANLQGAGVLIPALGPGAAMTFKVTCIPQ